LLRGPGWAAVAAGSKSQVIVAAEAFGSGSESGHFPAMLDELSERMGALTGGEEHREMRAGDTGGERRLGGKSGRRVCEKAGTAGLPVVNELVTIFV
jgi:hypothetical protein